MLVAACKQLTRGDKKPRQVTGQSFPLVRTFVPGKILHNR